MNRVTSLITLIVALMSGAAVLAAPLPNAPWYAVVWERTSDTLHWINAAGEQLSIARPKVQVEVTDVRRIQVHMSPNGRTLVVTSPIQQGGYGIAFYDLESGQFTNLFTTTADEEPSRVGGAQFTESGSHYATALRSANGDWRIVVLTANGSESAQLTRTSPNLPDNFITDPTWWARIGDFNVDEGLGQVVVRLQLVTEPSTQFITFPSFTWYPFMNTPIAPDGLAFNPYTGFDVLPTTGEVVFPWFDKGGQSPQIATDANLIATQANVQSGAMMVFDAGNGRVNSAKWLRNGDWIGYRLEDGVFAEHIVVSDRNGGGANPLGPNFNRVYTTPDGFVAKDPTAQQLVHVTDLNYEARTSTPGSMIFQANGPFEVIYTTPAGAVFSLPSVDTPVVANDLGVQAPQAECPGAPAPRLSVGAGARVTFTDGTPLNVRQQPGGALVTTLQEGTLVAVIDGPQCLNGYRWWNLRMNDGVTGWSAEGDSEDYYLEPIMVTDLTISAATPVPPRAIETPLIVSVIPTATPARVITSVICSNSPAARVSVGSNAWVANINGTLAVYQNVDSATPLANIAPGTIMSVIGGPACRTSNNQRMWQVNVTINGQPATGWVTEGSGSNYAITPNPPRANN
ncbi:MAG: hypothetical protein IPM16_11460 [Chloroflexi bacterium]|nr:hypothetical protein [Chloroflexota bacterium]